MSSARVTVEAYAGYKGEETPRSFTIDGLRHVVTEILDRWHGETHSYFRVATAAGDRYVLRHELDEGVWELVMQERT